MTLLFRNPRLKAEWTYNTDGQVATVKYPSATSFYPAPVPSGQVETLATMTGPQYTHEFDNQGRPVRMKQGGMTVFGDVQYGPGGEIKQWGSEWRTYNARGQLTTIQAQYGTITYGYSATQNDGRITSMTTPNETVTYQYDALGRLAQAATANNDWGQAYTYDGWGNLTGMSVTKGSAPTMSTTADPATNRLNAWSYDANGNATYIPGTGNLTYDAANRLTTLNAEQYGYYSNNQRLWKGNSYSANWYFWGADGAKMGTYQLLTVQGSDPLGLEPTYAHHPEFAVSANEGGAPYLTFQGRRLAGDDRLGSVVGSGQRYYPYGQERTTTPNNADKFATYFRDSSGLDYAQQRYYASAWGRFVTADPLDSSAKTYDPQTQHRASYSWNDPVNMMDSFGLEPQWPVPGPLITYSCHFVERTGGGLELRCVTQIQPLPDGPQPMSDGTSPQLQELADKFLKECLDLVEKEKSRMLAEHFKEAIRYAVVGLPVPIFLGAVSGATAGVWFMPPGAWATGPIGAVMGGTVAMFSNLASSMASYWVSQRPYYLKTTLDPWVARQVRECEQQAQRIATASVSQ